MDLLLVSGILACTVHLAAERIDHYSFPRGDEGSWMAVAARLSRGRGFTTRWLEHPFQEPYALPRPDDYRYPGLTVLLALGFTVAGISVTTALWVVALIFLLYGILVYGVAAAFFDRATAVCAMLCTVFSLLQLHWNTMVYTEGLFGAVLAVLVLWSVRPCRKTSGYWIGIGALTGALYLVRPNAVLFVPALFIHAAWEFRSARPALRSAGIALAAMAAVMSPYLIRNALCFGNPFHIAGSAGLLRATPEEPVTYSFAKFVVLHGMGFFFKSTVLGFRDFFVYLHEFEHGLEVIPLALAAVGMAMKRTFYNACIVAGFVVSFIASCYASDNSWAGLRYFTPFLPFVYAYGISTGLWLARRYVPRKIAGAQWAIPLLFACMLLVPVYYPHRYYERKYSSAPRQDPGFSRHRAILNRFLVKGDSYFAWSYAQLNFGTGFNCIGMDLFFNPEETVRALHHFDPKLIVLTDGELRNGRIRSCITALGNEGKNVRIAARDESTGYYVIEDGG